jgi:prepilin-type N-terminal cleavage/methylation domain-containing protein
MNILNRTKTILLNRTYPSKGFTLIELLVVILIISILSTIVVLGLMQTKKKACITVARYDLKKFFEAEQTYYGNHDIVKGGIGDVISNDPNVLSTFSLDFFSPSANTVITITDDDPFTVVVRNQGAELTFECNLNTGIITEGQ